MSEREIEDRLHRMGEGEATEPGEPTPFAAVREVMERRRRNRLVGVTAAVSMVVAVPLGWAAINGVVGGEPETPPATSVEGPDCPDVIPRRDGNALVTVPGGGNAAEPGELVPDGEPVGIEVCQYRTQHLADDVESPLQGSKTLEGDPAVVADLRDVAPNHGLRRSVCDIDGAVTPYLVRIDYEEGSAWVAATDDETCGYGRTDSTNGSEEFDHVGAQMAEAYEVGAWPGLQGTGCDDPLALRAELRTRMVPEEEPTSVHVCSPIGPDEGTSVDDVSGVVDALRSAADEGKTTALSDPMESLRCPPNAQVLITEVHLRYETGPDVEVTVAPACTPQVSTGGGGADLTPELEEALDLD